MSVVRKLSIVVILSCATLSASNAVAAESLEKAMEAYEFQEYSEAARLLRPWAERGQPEAQYRLGMLYENGQGVEQSNAEARKWFERAAANGYERAARRLEGAEKKTLPKGSSPSVALKWYQDLADQGEPDAQYNLGMMYETGFSVPKDDTKAAEWYESAARKKHAKAQLRLGLMYLSGSGVKQSEIQAEKWLSAASELGNVVAVAAKESLLDANPDWQLNIAELAERARALSSKDEKKAQAFLVNAAHDARVKWEQDKAEKEAQLAKRKSIQSAMEQTATEGEVGLDAQGRRTIKWYQHYAEHGQAAVQYQLAKYYELGNDVPMNISEAVRWYRQAAEQGFVDAQYYFGMLVMNGIGVSKDEVLGQSLVKTAAGQGSAQAKEALERTAGRGLDHDSAAIWWLMRPGQERHGLAMQQLGDLYEHGRGVAMNAAQAKHWHQRAAEVGFVAPAAAPAAPLTEPALTRPETPKSPSAAPAATAKSENKSAPLRKTTEPEPTATSVSTPDYVKYGLFAAAAAVPLAVFGWFVSREKQRMGEGKHAAKRPASPTKPAVVKQPRPTADKPKPKPAPANPFSDL